MPKAKRSIWKLKKLWIDGFFDDADHEPEEEYIETGADLEVFMGKI
ncbi:MAG: hypothetical protein ACRBM6_25660 [Geminicoccales bacterium]